MSHNSHQFQFQFALRKSKSEKIYRNVPDTGRSLVSNSWDNAQGVRNYGEFGGFIRANVALNYLVHD